MSKVGDSRERMAHILSSARFSILPRRQSKSRGRFAEHQRRLIPQGVRFCSFFFLFFFSLSSPNSLLFANYFARNRLETKKLPTPRRSLSLSVCVSQCFVISITRYLSSYTCAGDGGGGVSRFAPWHYSLKCSKVFIWPCII